MQKNIGVCCYTGRQIDLRISAPKAGTARLTFQVRCPPSLHWQLLALGFVGFRVLGVGFTIACGYQCKTSAKLLYPGLCSLTGAAMGSRS
jgi:hypothetical protein